MKLLIERASGTPDPDGDDDPPSKRKARERAGASAPKAKRSGRLVKSLKRLSVILLGWEFRG